MGDLAAKQTPRSVEIVGSAGYYGKYRKVGSSTSGIFYLSIVFFPGRRGGGGRKRLSGRGYRFDTRYGTRGETSRGFRGASSQQVRKVQKDLFSGRLGRIHENEDELDGTQARSVLLRLPLPLHHRGELSERRSGTDIPPVFGQEDRMDAPQGGGGPR